MRFSFPSVFLLLLVLPFLVYFTFRAERYLGKIERAFTLKGMKTPTWRRAARLAVPGFAAFWMIVALSGPAVEVLRPEETSYRTSLVIGLDVSKSMLAEDVMLASGEREAVVLSNRLNLARRFLGRLLDDLENEKTGLYFFADRGLEIVPLTRDHGFLRYVLMHADVMEMTESGSDLSEAMVTAKEMLETADASGVRVLLLISDGEDTGRNFEGIQQTISHFSARGMRVFCVGVGGKRPVFIPVRKKGMEGAEGFYRDPEGNYLQTSLEEDLLKRISAETNGSYFQLKKDDLSRISQELLARLEAYPPREVSSESMQKRWLDLAGLFLALGLLSYTAYLML